jgi:hypothetical protein
MKKRLIASSLLLVAALASAAQTPPDWVKYSPPGAQFKVLLPAQPKVDTQTADSPHGPYTTHLFSSSTPDRQLYVVGWVDYDPKFNFGVQAELEANRDKFVTAVKGRLLGTTPIKLGTHPGIEFKAVIDGSGVNIISRVYVVGRRPYQLIAISAAGADASRNVERFFSSFEVPAAK